MHYNGTNIYLFVNGTEIIKFKAKDYEVVTTPLCMGNISKDFPVDSMKKTVLNGYVYDFSVNYDDIVDDILDTHKYLIIYIYIYTYKMLFGFVKNFFFIQDWHCLVAML